MQKFTECAVTAARKAGDFLKERFFSKHTITYKGDINIVTEADMGSEEIIVAAIRASFPSHDILAEESAATVKGSAYRWIIDPLDGTTNYAHGFPFFCISIALEKDGEIILGIVYNPMLEELFRAQKGGGAWLNDASIAVSDTSDLSKGLLATGFPYDIRENPNNNINYFNEMALKARAVRRAGAAALDLAYVAAGRFDGFWELQLHPWDTAAGWLLIEEAGGIVSDLSGKPYSIASPSILASNGNLHAPMIEILRHTDPLDKRIQS